MARQILNHIVAWWSAIPPLLRFLAMHALIGASVAWGFAALLVYADLFGIGTLMAKSADPWMAFLALGFLCTITFSGVSMASAVMGLPWSDDDDTHGA